MDDTIEETKTPLLTRMLGRDPFKIPCFRTTFLYSMSSYVGVTLLTFLFTSKPAYSSHVGMGSFVIVTLGYYSFCRYQLMSDKYQSAKLQEYMQRAAIMEGVEPENEKPKLEEA